MQYAIISTPTYQISNEQRQKQLKFYDLEDVIKELETDNYYHSIIKEDDCINLLFDVDGIDEDITDLTELLDDLKQFLIKELKI